MSQQVSLQRRLERLAASGICPAGDVDDYAKELRALASRTVDEGLIKRQGRIFRALAEPIRIRMLKLLALREMCVCEVMAAFDLTQPTTSHHLGILEAAGLVESRREGKWVFFKLANPKLVVLADQVAKQVPLAT